MSKVELRLPSFWDDTQASPVLLLNRGAERRRQLREIIIETLRLVKGQPTGRELQKFCGIRRKTFLPLFRALLDSGAIERIGGGSKGNPFRYRLNEQKSR
jgi:hypothetical protein